MSGMGYSQMTLSLASITKLIKALRNGLEDFDKDQMVAANDAALNIASNELHVTLMYDKSDPEIDPGVNRDSYPAKIVGVERMGDPTGGYFALALILDCPGMQKRFKELQELGFQHSFPDLKTHISLNYGKETDVIYDAVKRIFEAGKLPEEITLVNESWNEAR